MTFEIWRDRLRWIIEQTESTFANDIFANRPFHGQIKIGVRSLYFSSTLYMPMHH
jgi:hypothetical protein